jgi:hypothetical protein
MKNYKELFTFIGAIKLKFFTLTNGIIRNDDPKEKAARRYW